MKHTTHVGYLEAIAQFAQEGKHTYEALLHYAVNENHITELGTLQTTHGPKKIGFVFLDRRSNFGIDKPIVVQLAGSAHDFETFTKAESFWKSNGFVFDARKVCTWSGDDKESEYVHCYTDDALPPPLFELYQGLYGGDEDDENDE